KFSPAGSKVTVKSRAADGKVYISIADRGRGIPEEFQRALFDRFNQAYETDATEKRGFGLGLSICKLIMQQLPCSISVQSTLGEGSTFTVSVPMEKVGEEAPFPVPASGESAAKAHPLSRLLTDTKIRHKGLILVSLPLLCQVVFVAAMAWLLNQANNEIK